MREAIMQNQSLPVVFLTIFLGIMPLTSLGHHSAAGRFDTAGLMELEGSVTRLGWRNPHVSIMLEVQGEDSGDTTSWLLEMGSANQLGRIGIARDAIQVGDHIRVAGWPPITERREMFVSNVLTTDGDEFLMTFNASLIWTDESPGDMSFMFRTAGDSSRPDLGIFRVWSHTFESPFLFPGTLDPNYDLENYPMTADAREAVRVFDRARDNPTLNCQPKGMPIVMEQPRPMEIVRDGDNVLIRIEEYDLLRTIYMDAATAPSPQSATLLGHSVGRWEGSTLVVETTHVAYPRFNQLGIPQSDQSVVVERFGVTEDGSRLDYTVTVTDPVYFTEPVTLEKFWLYLPDQRVEPYNCTPGEYEQNAGA